MDRFYRSPELVRDVQLVCIEEENNPIVNGLLKKKNPDMIVKDFTCPPFQQTTEGRQQNRNLGRLAVSPRRGFPVCRSLLRTSTLGS